MSFVALACLLVALDGDTLRCGAERIRLIGIDAPELPGHCAKGRDCAPGDPTAAQASLAALAKGSAEIERDGVDDYGRTLARVRVNGTELSCAQLKKGHAVYRSEWDPYGNVTVACGLQVVEPYVTPVRSEARRTKRHSPSDQGVFRNCAAARAAGAAPLYRGQPGYGAHMDGDGDGIACEPYRGR
ncbi:thermonuclease family protein [Sphingomonas mucosissima]|uniref:Excalibur calcium-binding domain protein n=1 Tax=Sphingomonas mucosissima TaxID=370959 RepID=A0A245ZE38_9SPHN|nr:excalibur calcium-binding domain protein [Sphingomonas mucosissima]